MGVALAVLLVASAAATYQIGVRAKRPPHFRRGGVFVSSGADDAIAAAAPGTPGGADGGVTGSTTSSSVAGTATSPPGTSTVATRSGSASNARLTAAAGAPAGAQAGQAQPTSTDALPRLGTYTWAVQGTETATGFGSRSFPPTMTMTSHRDNSVAPDEIVLDTTYSSDHTEREIVSYRRDGVFFDFEAGQVRFGPMAQSNQGDYRPPMLQVPPTDVPGTRITGRSVATAADGSTERTEDWTVTVAGRQTLTIAGESVSTIMMTIDRQTTPGSDQQVHRTRTYWYDPSRRLWIKYTERMHGQQHYAGITFTYDDDLTATLTGFQPDS